MECLYKQPSKLRNSDLGKIKRSINEKLETCLKASVRLITTGRYHTEPIMKNNNLLALTDIYKKELIRLAWNYYKNILHTKLYYEHATAKQYKNQFAKASCSNHSCNKTSNRQIPN